MPDPWAILDALLKLTDQGGLVLVAIFAVSLFMWTLILERYLYLQHRYPRDLERRLEAWRQRRDHSSWYAQRIREGLIAELAVSLRSWLRTIETLTAILPLLGLLGTVIGMIATFEVMKLFGTGNARGLASGISTALITTTAGLVTSISGLYFSANLNHRAEIEVNKARDMLQ